MAASTSKHGAGIAGPGAAACAACCAPPIIGFLAAASISTLIGVALFGLVGWPSSSSPQPLPPPLERQ